MRVFVTSAEFMPVSMYLLCDDACCLYTLWPHKLYVPRMSKDPWVHTMHFQVLPKEISLCEK